MNGKTLVLIKHLRVQHDGDNRKMVQLVHLWSLFLRVQLGEWATDAVALATPLMSSDPTIVGLLVR